MRKALIILSALLFLLTISGLRSQTATTNAGFVSSNNIWYSIDPFEEGQNVGIYTLVFNPDSRELSGTVVFFDSSTVLGTKDFKVPANGVEEIHINWRATAGTHTIFGRIENARFLISSGKYEDAYLSQNETSKSSRTVLEKVVQKTNEESTDSNSNSALSSNTDNISSGLIQKIEKVVKEKTPDFVSKPINATSNAIEKVGNNISTSSETKKKEISKEIKDSATIKTSDKTAESKKILKPLKYMELFFYTLLSFIFSNKIIFYGILLLILFFIIRFIWHKIF